MYIKKRKGLLRLLSGRPANQPILKEHFFVKMWICFMIFHVFITQIRTSVMIRMVVVNNFVSINMDLFLVDVSQGTRQMLTIRRSVKVRDFFLLSDCGVHLLSPCPGHYV